ncbi:hypothetical protein [Mycobacterium sp. NPDC050853]|uniref:hypothetical protein n=1 Tax=Mycobacterium sp. NPDC050853 TaxID=3155160 RepID=UPI0033D99296
MPPRTTRITHGKRLVKTLNASLAQGAEWTEAELITLAQIEQAADRASELQRLFDAEVAKSPVSTRRVTEVAAEVRQTEAMITRLVAGLAPDPNEPPKGAARPKSAKHQKAAMTRWHPPVAVDG